MYMSYVHVVYVGVINALWPIIIVVHHGPLRPAVGMVVHIYTIVPLDQTIFFPHHSATSIVD